MPRLISKSTISNFTRLEVLFGETPTGQYMYTRLAITGSLNEVETDKSSKRFFGLTPKFIAIYGVTKEKLVRGSNNT